MPMVKQRLTAPPQPGSRERSRLSAALLAGSLAIAVNTALLIGADGIGFTTARGGLLRLVKTMAGDLAAVLNLETFWTRTLAPATTGFAFQTGFHVVVGLLMALLYAFVLEPILPGRPLVRA